MLTYAMFHIEFVHMLMIHPQTELNVSSCNGSIVITIKLKAKYQVFTAAMLFYVLQKITLTNVIYLSHITTEPYSSSANVTPTPSSHEYHVCITDCRKLKV